MSDILRKTIVLVLNCIWQAINIRLQTGDRLLEDVDECGNILPRERSGLKAGCDSLRARIQRVGK